MPGPPAGQGAQAELAPFTPGLCARASQENGASVTLPRTLLTHISGRFYFSSVKNNCRISLVVQWLRIHLSM